MRRWTQSVKQTISERTTIEADAALRSAWNQANPSKEPLTGPLSNEQKNQVDQEGNAKFEKELLKAFDEVVEKAELMLRLEAPSLYRTTKSKNSGLKSQFSVMLEKKL